MGIKKENPLYQNIGTRRKSYEWLQQKNNHNNPKIIPHNPNNLKNCS